MKKCTNCNTENKDEALFCESCGTKIEVLEPADNITNKTDSNSEKDAKSETDNDIEIHNQEVTPDTSNSETITQDTESTNDIPPNNKKKKAIITISIIVGVICVGVALGLSIPVITNSIKYKGANKSFNSGDFENAHQAYVELGDYKDATNKTTDACIMQLDKLLKDNANLEEIVKWLELSINRNEDRVYEVLSNATSENIKNGKHDVSYNLLINNLGEYKDKYKDMAYTLANEYILNVKAYDKGKNLLTWIGDNNYKDTEKLLSEITYQSVVANIKDDPQSVIKDLYPLAKANYNDSRSLLEYIYTSDELFGKLQFSNVKTVEEQASISFYDVEMEGGTRNCNVELVVKNNSDVPVVGDVSVKCAFFSEYEGRLSKTSSINIKLAPGEEKAFKSSRFSFEGLGAFEKSSVSKNTGKDKLRIDYE